MNTPNLLVKGLFSTNLFTDTDGIEKTTMITLGSTTLIDVDNNPNTGENGAEIKVIYYITPAIEFTSEIIISLKFTLNIDTLGDYIKNSDFKAFLEFGGNKIILGYSSPSETGNEVPDNMTLSFKISLYLFQRTIGYTLNMEPIFESGNENKKIELFAEFNSDTSQRKLAVQYDPAIVTEISLISSKKQGVWNYDFSRTSSEESKVTSTFTNDGKETIVIIDKLPTDLKFSLSMTPLTEGGGQFTYESNQMYNIEMQIQSNELGNLKYLIIKNTPRSIFAEWIPTITNGRYSLEMDSDGTDFILRDSQVDPTIDFSINNLESIGFDAYWNLSNPGDFIIYKYTAINIDLDFKIGNWIAQINTQPTADIINVKWLIDIKGYLIIDTDWEPLATVDLKIQGPLIGLHTVGQTFKTQDFRINWTLWPPQEFNLVVTGQINVFSISIDLLLNGQWRHLWPW
jgi:hypothetical protein